jgi:serine/threonine protein kinase
VLSPLGLELKRSKYRLLGLVGQGQFGRVFCAVHRQTGRLVALKNLEQQRFPTHKFLRELRFLLSLQHANIVTCQALEHTATSRSLVMDYCEGGTLRNLMSEECPLSLPQSLKLVIDILLGLEHAHERGIIHCDIKPENILLNLRPNGWTARISDFGISKLSQELITQDLGNTGSPAYMAPERFYGQYSFTSDLYSVGIILFELMTGQRPFSGTPLDLMSAHLNSPVPLSDSIPELWQPLILTALQKLVGRRFHSATAMIAALRSIAIQTGINLDSEAIALPLLHYKALPCQPVRFESQESLQQQVNCIDIQADHPSKPPNQTSNTIYWAEGKQLIKKAVFLQNSANPVNHLMLQEQRVSLPTSIRELRCRPQGCFAIAQDALYLLPTDAQVAQRITALGQQSQVAIDPQGRWVAIASTDQAGMITLKIKRLPHPKSNITVADRPLPIAKGKVARLLQVTALSSHHIAAILAVSIPGQAQDRFDTLIEIFTRRGDRVGSLTLQISIAQAIATVTPYRLLATEKNYPHTLLLIDLKPLRILRVSIGIIPKLLTTLSWGYAILNAEGAIVLLDLFGQSIGQLQGFDSPTAVAAIHPHHLVTANWSSDRGDLHTLNLKDQNIDLLF